MLLSGELGGTNGRYSGVLRGWQVLGEMGFTLAAVSRRRINAQPSRSLALRAELTIPAARLPAGLALRPSVHRERECCGVLQRTGRGGNCDRRGDVLDGQIDIDERCVAAVQHA